MAEDSARVIQKRGFTSLLVLNFTCTGPKWGFPSLLDRFVAEHRSFYACVDQFDRRGCTMLP